MIIFKYTFDLIVYLQLYQSFVLVNSTDRIFGVNTQHVHFVDPSGCLFLLPKFRMRCRPVTSDVGRARIGQASLLLLGLVRCRGSSSERARKSTRASLARVILVCGRLGSGFNFSGANLRLVRFRWLTSHFSTMFRLGTAAHRMVNSP